MTFEVALFGCVFSFNRFIFIILCIWLFSQGIFAVQPSSTFTEYRASDWFAFTIAQAFTCLTSAMDHFSNLIRCIFGTRRHWTWNKNGPWCGFKGFISTCLWVDVRGHTSNGCVPVSNLQMCSFDILSGWLISRSFTGPEAIFFLHTLILACVMVEHDVA